MIIDSGALGKKVITELNLPATAMESRRTGFFYAISWVETVEILLVEFFGKGSRN